MRVGMNMPLNATVEKQNCGVKVGGGEGWVMMSFGAHLNASAPEDFCQK